VFFDTSGAGLTADELARRVRGQGVLVSTVGAYRVRACTHLDVDAASVALAVQVISQAVQNPGG
jgi:threonine aldolase